MTRTGRASLITVVFAGLVYLGFSIAWRYVGDDGQGWHGAIGSDGDGYYAYLTGTFIDHDLEHIRAAEYHFAPAGEGSVIKYFCGTALIEAPFFLAAHAWCSFTGTPADGRALPYQIAIGIAALCCLCFGAVQSRALLRSFGVNDGAVAFALAVILFGTGLLYQAVMTPSMSHTAAFAMIAWAMNELRAARSGRRGALLRSSVAAALVFLIRPVDIMALLALPLLWMDHEQGFLAWVRAIPARRWLFAIAIFLSIVALQPLLWYLQCGRWLVAPYAGEGFLWDRPMIFSVLFGARKGLFFYWPLLLLAIPGTLVIGRRSIGAAIALMIAVLMITYVSSCWWIWYYGHSYGMRPMLDHLALFAVPIAFFFDRLAVRARSITLAATLPLLLLQCFQAWQFHVGILHPFNMDREKYRLIFLRTGEGYRGMIGDAYTAPPYAPHGCDVLLDTTVIPAGTRSGTWLVDGSTRIGSVAELSAAELPAGRMFYVEMECGRKALDPGASNSVEVVCAIGEAVGPRYFNSYRLNDIRLPDDRQWRHWRLAFYAPQARAGEALRVFFAQNGDGRVLIRDLKIKISAAR